MDGQKELSFLREDVEKAFQDASFYDRVRPSYPPEAVEFLLEKLGLLSRDSTSSGAPSSHRTVLELGCGTGKFTRVMMEILQGSGVRIIASDSLKSMCDQFRQSVPEVEILQGSAEDIALPTSSVDAIIAANSFHYFANEKALGEINRVLKSGGKLGIVFLFADKSVGWVKEFWDYVEPLYHQKSIPFAPDRKWKDIVAASSIFGNALNKSFKFKNFCTPSSALETYKSYSVLAIASEDVKEKFKIFFEQLIEKHFTKKNEMFSFIPKILTLDWYEKQSSGNLNQC